MKQTIIDSGYTSALRASERVAWTLDEVFPEGTRLGFERPFLPDGLAGANALDFLSATERLALNHIRAHGYLCTFGLVEELILPFVLERLTDRVDAELGEIQALLAFAGEEAKHIELFRRFRRAFERDFGGRCEMIGPAGAIREHVLGRSQLGVGLLILHIEWMTQHHYLAMVRSEASLDPSFSRLLHQHWLEECQHARIDGWIVESVAAASSPEQRAEAFADYVRLLEFFASGLERQVELDLEALERVTSRRLSDAERSRFRDVQRKAGQRTFLASGLEHPRVRSALVAVYPEGGAALDALVRRYG